MKSARICAAAVFGLLAFGTVSAEAASPISPLAAPAPVTSAPWSRRPGFVAGALQLGARSAPWSRAAVGPWLGSAAQSGLLLDAPAAPLWAAALGSGLPPLVTAVLSGRDV